MQEKHLYEYAVIRVLPAVERDEFINAGVILFCKRQKFITVHLSVNETRLAAFPCELDLEQINMNLQSFKNIALGLKTAGPIAQMELAERFRWLTAVRSSCIQ